MSAITRIGVLTGGGDAPGLNAVIRAVVKAAWNSGIESVGHRRQLRRPARAGSLARADAARRHRHPAARRHDPRHAQHRQSVQLRGDDLRRRARIRRSRHRDVPPAGPRRADRDRRRRHARDRARVLPARHADRRRPEDHRQRHRRHDQLFRIRHGGGLRHRCDRSAAHDGRSAQAHPGRRGDGPLCRLDCAVCRRRRRRRRDPDSGDSVRHRAWSRSGCASATTGAPSSASSSSPRARFRRAARCR